MQRESVHGGVTEISSSARAPRKSAGRTQGRQLIAAASLSLGTALLSAGTAQATTIAANGYVSLASAATFPTATLGSDGYDIFQTNPTTSANTTGTDTLSPVSYASVAVGPISLSTYAGNTANFYSRLTIGGTPQFTGEYYATTTNGSLSSKALVTITLSNTNPIPAEFQIGMLLDNTNSVNNENVNFTVFDSGNAGAAANTGPSAATNDNAPIQTVQNDFYLVDITGASPGDVISIYGIGNTHNRVDIAGVTFDTLIAAPEPGSLVTMLGIAGLGLLAAGDRSVPDCVFEDVAKRRVQPDGGGYKC